MLILTVHQIASHGECGQLTPLQKWLLHCVSFDFFFFFFFTHLLEYLNKPFSSFNPFTFILLDNIIQTPDKLHRSSLALI